MTADKDMTAPFHFHIQEDFPLGINIAAEHKSCCLNFLYYSTLFPSPYHMSVKLDVQERNWFGQKNRDDTGKAKIRRK